MCCIVIGISMYKAVMQVQAFCREFVYVVSSCSWHIFVTFSQRALIKVPVVVMSSFVFIAKVLLDSVITYIYKS